MVDNAHNDEVAPQLSPPQRPLCVTERLGRKKKEARGARWERKIEKRGLFHITCGCLAGFVVLWFWLNQETIWTLQRVKIME